MKILLVNPPARRFVCFQGGNFPLGLGYIAAILEREKYDVKIYDAEWNIASFNNPSKPKNFLSFMAKNWFRYFEALKNPDHEIWHEIEDVFRKHNPDVIGITCRVLDLPSAQLLANIAKKINPETIVILGGPAATTKTEVVLRDPNIDFVIRGEGEMTMLELLNILQAPSPDLDSVDGLSFRKSGKIIHNNPRRLIEDISSLPFPARHLLLDIEKVPEMQRRAMLGEIITSRGCPFHCTFCSNFSIWGSKKPRLRAMSEVVDEILFLKRTYGVSKFIIWDDLFVINRQRTIGFCSLLLQENADIEWICLARADSLDPDLLKIMKEAGCTEIQIGVESGSERILKKMRKGITLDQIRHASRLVREAGLNLHIFLLIGIPGETKEEMESTIQLIDEIKPDHAELSVFAPYPGSALYDDVKEMGILDETENGWLHADFLNTDYCYAGTMSAEEFRSLAISYLMQCDEYNHSLANLVKNIRRAFLRKYKRLIKKGNPILYKI